MVRTVETRDIVFECRGVTHAFGDNRVLHDVNLEVARGEILALVGPSGCGKSTLLRAILGTHPSNSGEIRMNGDQVTGPDRDRGIVYQRYSLFPFLTAVENVAFGLMVDQTKLHDRFFRPLQWRELRKRHLAEAAEMLDRVKLGKALDLYPSEMSGGMCQRVAIAQALIMRPEILLLDEPFGALDEATRESLQELLLELYSENLDARAKGEKPPHTILIVTHELNEALYVSDRVVGLSQYWKWEADGHSSCPGATIVYDKVAPVFSTDQPRDPEALIEQREELRGVAFEPKERLPRDQNVRFWQQVEEGLGQGMLAP